MADYPKRPRFFANRFVRLMAKACLAQEIGPEACWMLTLIAITEDAGGYRKPVTFWNEQLFSLAGIGSVSALKRLREKVVEAGWLHYAPGAKGRAARYWVIIPAHLDGMDDGPSDEQPGEYSGSKMDQKGRNCSPEMNQNNDGSSPEMNQKADRIRTECEPESGQNPDRMRTECGPHSSLSLPLPLSLTLTADFAAAAFAEFWNQYPNKARKNYAEREWDAMLITEGVVGEIMAGLDRWKNSLEWAKEGGRFIPQPANWLRDRRWTESPISNAPASRGNGKPTIAELLAAEERRLAELEAKGGAK